MHQYTSHQIKNEYSQSQTAKAHFSIEQVNAFNRSDVLALQHRRASEIFQRIRILRSRLKHNRERLLLGYIIDATLGYGKLSDQISNSQFMKGKRCLKTGKVIDLGCGLKSINTIRKARASLVKQGIIFEISEKDEYGAQSANRYGLVFILDLLELEQLRKQCRNLRKVTRGSTNHCTLQRNLQRRLLYNVVEPRSENS